MVAAAAALGAAEPAPLGRLGRASRVDVAHSREYVLVRRAAGAAGAKLAPAGAEPVFGRWLRVPVASGDSPQSALRKWLAVPGVEVAELAYMAHPFAVPSPAATAGAEPPPNDPLFHYQWHLPAIQLPAAWQRSRGQGVTVAVVDTGVARGGQDLQCRSFVAEYDAYLDVAGPQSAARDLLGHGTHVAGTIGQCTGNGVGVAGVAPDVTLMPIVASNPDAPRDLPDDVLARGVVWAVEHGAKVVNLAVGTDCGGVEWPDCSADVLNDAIELATAADVLVVAAAGNSHEGSVAYPANHPDVLAVTALGPLELAPYANHGAAVDLAAPGGDHRVDLDGDGHSDVIYQESLGSFCGAGQPYAYCGVEGTSMATAHVAGAAALLRAYRPTATARQVRKALEDSAADLGAPGKDPFYGAGALRADDALTGLDALLAAAGGPCVPSPTTLCIDDVPGDRRFRLEVAFATVQAGGRSGMAQAVPLSPEGIRAGGVFWFFGLDNPEMLAKVLDACPVNGRFWVYASAGTNVGYTLTVTDTATERVQRYSNPDLTPALPIQDTAAFPCD